MTLVVGVLVLRRPGKNVAGMVMALVPGAALLLAGVLAGDLDRVFEFNPFRYAAALAAVAALVHPPAAPSGARSASPGSAW